MANLVELNGKVKDSLLTCPTIAKKLGITANSLRNKLSGKTEFKMSEVKELSKLLRLTQKEVVSIFLT